MWPFTERRRNKRYRVNWHGLLRAHFPEQTNALPCSVHEVSRRGARLHLKTLRAGTYHIIADEPEQLNLELMLPTGLATLPLVTSWFDYAADVGIFVIGAQFVRIQPADGAALNEALRALRRRL